MANDAAVASLPGLTPAAMPPTGANGTSQEEAAVKKAEAIANAKTREPKLLFAVAKNVVNASNTARSKKQLAAASPTGKSPVATAGDASGNMRSMFGVIKRVQASKPKLQATQASQPQQQPQPSEEANAVVSQNSASQEQKEVQAERTHSSASAKADDRAGVNCSEQDECNFVDDVRETLEKLVTQLDSVDPRKLLAVRLGGELRGLLGKAQDEFAAYETEFVEHASSEGVSVALQNFSASLTQVSAIAERLRTAKFLLNRTFKREVLFAFQEINSYYTSLFMELAMAVARRSGIDLPLPAPVAPPEEPMEPPPPSADEICLEAHQYFFGHGVAKNLRKALEHYTVRNAFCFPRSPPPSSYVTRVCMTQQAADLGCTSAMTCLGQMYFAGNGAEKDLLVAGRWFELAASGGDSEACYQLALLMVRQQFHSILANILWQSDGNVPCAPPSVKNLLT
jgi:hypothetical protein